MVTEPKSAPGLSEDPPCVYPVVHCLVLIHDHSFQCRQHGGVHAWRLFGRVLRESLRQEFFVPNCVQTHRSELLIGIDWCRLLQEHHGLVRVPQRASVARFAEPHLEVLKERFQGRRKRDRVVFPIATSGTSLLHGPQCRDRSPTADQRRVPRPRPERVPHGGLSLCQEVCQVSNPSGPLGILCLLTSVRTLVDRPLETRNVHFGWFRSSKQKMSPCKFCPLLHCPLLLFSIVQVQRCLYVADRSETRLLSRRSRNDVKTESNKGLLIARWQCLTSYQGPIQDPDILEWTCRHSRSFRCSPQSWLFRIAVPLLLLC